MTNAENIIKLVINALDSMIETMTTKRDAYIGRSQQLDEDIDRLMLFKSSLQRDVVEHETKEVKSNENTSI